MKKILLVLLLILPFSTFASSLDEVKNLKIEIKWKSINGLSLYYSIEKTLEKKTKWDNNKKLALYKKLLSQTEKSNNDIYKKLSIILNYWKNETQKEASKINENLENNNIANNSYILKYNNEDYILYLTNSELESLNEYNKLSEEYYALLKETEKLSNKIETLDNTENIYIPQGRQFTSGSISSILYWKINKCHKDSNWIWKPKKFNYYKNCINSFLDNYWKHIESSDNEKLKEILEKEMTELIPKNDVYIKSRTMEEYVEEIRANNKESSNSAYYWNEWVIRWQGYFSDKEIQEAWKKAFNNYVDTRSEYEKQKSNVSFIYLDSNTLYDIPEITYRLETHRNRVITEFSNNEFNLVIKELIDNYNLYLSIFKDWWAVSDTSAIKAKESFIKFLTAEYKDYRTEDEFIMSLWYRYENWKIIYNESLNIYKENIKDIDYIKFEKKIN